VGSIRTAQSANVITPNAKVESIQGNSVELSNGGKPEADLVVAGVGVTPVMEFAEASGGSVQNGIVVNEFLETSAANAYAAGEVAKYQDVLFGMRGRWNTG
jgi:NAD(P)H-nitrite reductase large subunit